MSDPSRPRKLTEDELENILNHLPEPDAITKRHVEDIRRQLMNFIRDELEDEELCPDGIADFIQIMVQQFNSSRIGTGMTVGLWATESHGNKIQQDSLNTVHKAGAADSRGAGGAVERMKSLLLKQPGKVSTDMDSCTIIFKDIHTRQEIKLLKKPEIVFVDIATLLSTSNPYLIEYHVTLFPDGVLPSWYEPYCEAFALKLPDMTNKNRKLLRLFLDVEVMVELKVIMSDIRRALVAYDSRLFNFYLSPLHMGVVDIWAIEEEYYNSGNPKSSDIETDIFNVLYRFAGGLNKLRVKGIPGIRDVDPVKVDIWNLLTKDQPRKHIENHVYKYRIYSPAVSLLEWSRIADMFTFFGIDVLDYSFGTESDYMVLDGGSKGAAPHEIIDRALTEDRQKDTEYQKEAIDAKQRIVTRPVTPDRPIYWTEFWYARTVGTNLREILIREDVNPRLTISNKPAEVLNVFGVAAARRVLLEEIYKAYQGGREDPAFNARHMSLIADFTTYSGIIMPNNSLALQARSTLSKATSARQFETLMEAAMGTTDNLADVSSAIMVGSRLRIGPRAFEYENTVNKGVTAEEIRRAMQTGAESSEEIDQLMQTLASGAGGEAEEPLFGEDIEAGEDGGVADEDDEGHFYSEELVEALERGGGENADDEVIIKDDDEGLEVIEDDPDDPTNGDIGGGVRDRHLSSALRHTIEKFKVPLAQAASDSRADVQKSMSCSRPRRNPAPSRKSATARTFTGDLEEIENMAD